MNTIELLNEEQAAAIENKADRKLVIAGPGSGKTRLLVHAIAAECEGPLGTPFSQILVITYTNSAADELEKRLRRHFLNDELRLGFCGTLHAFCLKLLREDGHKVGLPSQLSVIDDEQREGLVQQIADEMGIKCSLSKALQMLDRRQVAFHASFMLTKEDLVAKEYRMRLRKAGLLDFDAILDYGLQLIAKMNTYEWPYSRLFVDELQDASDEDWAIYGAMPCAKKCMVGDPDQSVFGFRGGNPQNMVAAAELGDNPKASGPGVHEVFTLETNYRCGAQLCEAAQSLIEHNTHRFGKATIATHNDTQLIVTTLHSQQDELSWVGHGLSHAREVADIGNEHYSRFAILCRTNRLAKDFAQHLKAHGIPVAESKHAYAPPDWKMAKLLLAVLQAPWNDLLVEQYLKQSEDLSYLAVSATKPFPAIRLLAAKNMTSFNEALGFQFGHGDCNPSSLDVDISSHNLSLSSRERIHDAAKALSARTPKWTLSDLLVFLNAQEEAAIEVGEGVTVTTIHQAKGREWDCVFLPGWEEGILPSSKKGADLEEERRIAYVALTRARERVFITWCAERPEYRGLNLPPGPMQKREPSRFIKQAGL